MASLSDLAKYDVVTTWTRLANTITEAPRMNRSKRVMYSTLGKLAPAAKRYAIKVSMAVIATPIWLPASLGSIQNTTQDIATMRTSGTITLPMK